MARKISQTEKQPANLSIGQIKAALPKLHRRLDELNDFSPEQAAQSGDRSIAQALVDKIDQTLIDIFGHDTIEYDRYRIYSLYEQRVIVMTSRGGPSYQELFDNYTKGKSGAITKIKTAMSMLEERLTDATASPDGIAAPITLDGCDLYPAIQAACGQLYKDGHYADAVGKACIVLNGQVQAKSGNYDLTETALMENVFSPKNPILAFNDMRDKHDESEQQGMMFLYKGVFLAFRNQRAHKLIEDAPEYAFGAISTIDFLVKMLDKTVKGSAAK